MQKVILIWIAGWVLTGSIVAQAPAKFLPRVTSQAEFDSLAVTYDPDTPYALPHVLFVIDRGNNNRIYYVNTKKYPFHKDFVNGNYLSLERGRATVIVSLDARLFPELLPNESGTIKAMRSEP